MAGTTDTVYVAGVPSGAPGIIDTNAAKPSVQEDAEIIAPTTAKFLRAIGGENQWVEDKSYKREWIEPDVWTNRTLLAEALDNSETGVDITSGDQFRVQIGSVILVDDELMRVTGVASNTLTVVRDYAGTSAASHDNGATVYILTVTENEAGDSPSFYTPTKSKPYNYLQQIEAKVTLSQQAQSLDEYGRMMKFEERRQEVTKDLIKKLEGAVLRGVRYEGADADNPAMMGGVNYFITAANGAQVVDLNTTDLTEANLLTLNRGIIENVDEEYKAEEFWCGHYVADVIYSLYADRIRTTAGERTGGGDITRVVMPSGEMNIHAYRDILPSHTGYLLNHKHIRVGHWKGFGWITKPLAVDGFYDEETRGGVFGVEVRHVQAQGKIQEIALS